MSLRDTLRVMVVDDTSVSRGLMFQSLDELQVPHVDFRCDAMSALKALVANPVHLVLSDFHMPGMNGLELLHALRHYRTTQRIGFILVTDTVDRATIETGMQMGMNNYLMKPFSTHQLRACLETVVGPL